MTEDGATATDPRIEHALRGTLLTWWAEQQPDRLAVAGALGERTFEQLDARANQLVRALRRRGAGAGTAVALMMRNRAEWVEVWAACARGGYRLTPINWHLTGAEAGYIVDDCGATTFIADARHAAAAAEAAETAPGASVLLAVGGTIDGFDDYEQAVQAEEPAALGDATPGGQMMYTSGTTGRPKGVTRTGGISSAPAAQASSVFLRLARAFSACRHAMLFQEGR
jgi:long-chain acyl-CoA synthetase